MWKQVLQRGALGFPLGIALGHVIALLISIGIGDGSYNATVPSLTDTWGSEIAATVCQTILWGIWGMTFAATSVIWEIETWSLARQTGIYFFVTSVIMLLVGYFSQWFGHSLMELLIYYGFCIIIFIVIWTILHMFWRHKIKQMNKKMKQTERDEGVSRKNNANA